LLQIAFALKPGAFLFIKEAVCDEDEGERTFIIDEFSQIVRPASFYDRVIRESKVFKILERKVVRIPLLQVQCYYMLRSLIIEDSSMIE